MKMQKENELELLTEMEENLVAKTTEDDLQNDLRLNDSTMFDDNRLEDDEDDDDSEHLNSTRNHDLEKSGTDLGISLSGQHRINIDPKEKALDAILQNQLELQDMEVGIGFFWFFVSVLIY